MKTAHLIFSAFFLSGSLIACIERATLSRLEVSEQAVSQGGICSEPDFTGAPAKPENMAWLEVAWKQFVADGKHCVPNAKEFKIPGAAITDLSSKNDLEGTIKHPYGWGDFNGDHLYQDFVSFVVDKTTASSNKFGIVIFHEPKERNEIPQPYWLFKNSDLSKSIFDGGSGIFLIRTYSEDGTSQVCHVAWSKVKKSYSCVLKQPTNQ